MMSEWPAAAGGASCAWADAHPIDTTTRMVDPAHAAIQPKTLSLMANALSVGDIDTHQRAVTATTIESSLAMKCRTTFSS
jgi:hypothetical protein